MRLLGKEPDHGDGVAIYRHEHNGFLVRTHRTVRTSPAGWVYAVYDGTHDDDDGDQYTVGYAPTQRAALAIAAAFIDPAGARR